MGFIRLIKGKYFDRKLQRFQSLAFRNSSTKRGKGISVIQQECISGTGATKCAHVERYYHQNFDEPYIYWDIPKDILPSECEFDQETTASGDECHYNIRRLSNSAAKTIFKGIPITTFKICENSHARFLTLGDCQSL